MSTPANCRGQPAQGLEAQLQKYKEAAVNLPRLVKKYKSLEAQHVELRQQSDRTAAALDSAQRALSQAQSSNEALKGSFSKLKSEKSSLAAALEESKRQNAILQNRIAGQEQAQSRGEQPAPHPDSKLLSEAVRDAAALRSEVCSLRRVLAQRTDDAVLSELTTIKGQVAQLLQRCPKEDNFLATNTSRACTPVHESLASPPLQSMASLYTRPGTVDVHRGCATLVACGPQGADKQATKVSQPTSEASALSSQAALLCAASGAACGLHSLPSPCSNPLPPCALNSSIEPPSSLVTSGQAPAAAPSAPPASTASQHPAAPTAPVSGTVQGQLGPCSHKTAHRSSVHLSSKGAVPESVCAERSTQNGSWSPRKRDRDTCAPTSSPSACKGLKKKKHTSSADIATKGQEDIGFMKVQDVPAATRPRWKAQVREPQRKMMQFGTGTVKSTTVTGSCFSIGRKAAHGSVAPPGVQHSSRPEDAIEQGAATEGCKVASLQGDASLRRDSAACPIAPVVQCSQNVDAVVQPSPDYVMGEGSKAQETQGMQASVCVPEDNAANVQQPVKAVDEGAPIAEADATACEHGAKGGSSGSSQPAKGPENFADALLKAAPRLVPVVLTACTSCSASSSSAQVQRCTPQRSECSAELCKRAAALPAAAERCNSTGVAAEVAAHWEALGCREEQGEFAAELVSEVVHLVGSVSAAICESTVLSALADFQGRQIARGKCASCGDNVGKVHEQLHKLLDAQHSASFDATHWASVLCQAQARTSDSDPGICQAVARELCQAARSAGREAEERCEVGEVQDPSRLWFVRMQLAALVGLLAAQERKSSSILVQSSLPQHLMQMLTEAEDLVSAAAIVVGAVCGDVGSGSVFGRWHEDIVRFWSATDGSSSDPLPVSPCVLMLQVALCATAGAARECRGDPLTALSGEVVWALGQRIWGWCPAGAGTMQSLSAGLMQLLEAAGADASSAAWSLFREQEQLSNALDARCGASQQPAVPSVEDVESYSESSSSDGSSDSDDSGVADVGGEPQAHESVHAALHEVRQALMFASRCCGWKWTAHTLLDKVVWPVFERMQRFESPAAADVRRVTRELISDLLGLVRCLSNEDVAAAEYVAEVQEALQFVC